MLPGAEGERREGVLYILLNLLILSLLLISSAVKVLVLSVVVFSLDEVSLLFL